MSGAERLKVSTAIVRKLNPQCGFVLLDKLEPVSYTHLIAIGDSGKEITVERLAEIFLELQEKGAANLNLVTGAHYVPHIISALELARGKDVYKRQPPNLL